jgi:hypothetical protein
MEGSGIHLVRFENRLGFENIEGVLEEILGAIRNLI